MTIEQPSATAGLIERAKNLIMTPRAEWDRIAPEPANQSGILMGYVLPLAGLSAVAGAIGQAVFGLGAFGFHVTVPPVAAAISGGIALLMSLVMLFVFAFVLNMLAPSFGSQKDSGQAFKLAAYSCTAGWLAGLFAIYPPLAMLGILGLYSLVLLYLGMPRLMKTPEDKRVGYFAATIVVCIIAGIIISVVFGAVQAAIPGTARVNPFAMGAQSSNSASDDVQIKFGGATIDVGDAEKAAKQMEQAFGGMSGEGGEAMQPAVSTASLAALLPASLPGGFAKTASSDNAGMGMSMADATYQNGDAQIRVQIMHAGAFGAMAGNMAAAAGAQANEQTADGYSRMRTENGRTYTEALSRSAGTVGYAVLGRNGATISVEGSGGVSEAQVRAVLNAISIERVEALGGT